MPSYAAALLVLSLASSRALATYSLFKEYSGNTFFSGWEFLDGYDNTTNGAVNWLNESAAMSSNLAYINSNGNPVIKVDNTTNLPNVTVVTDQLKRNSVTLYSQDYFPVGSVILFDAVHLPWGCSVWPAFWTKGLDWPVGGEIDILESVNLRTFNQMALHTTAGCTQPKGVTQLGQTNDADCSAGPNSSWGCTVQELQPNSFGGGFNDAGGGVWATQFDVSGVFIWFWSRPNVPASLASDTTTIDTSTWGTPSASWPASSCQNPIADYFSPQQLVIDVTLCGDFAGEPNTYGQTCAQPGVTVDANTCYIENVNGTGANYADAYFEINYVKVFTVDGTALLPSVSAGSIVFTTDPGTATSSAPATTSNSATSASTTGTATVLSSPQSGNADSGSNGAVALSISSAVGLAGLVAAFAWSMI